MSDSAPVSPVLESPIPTILDPVDVPEGYFPIEVVQYWRGEYAPGRPLPLHWALVVRTSAGRGNCHEIVGDMETYATQDRFDVPIPHVDGGGGGCYVGVCGGGGGGGSVDDWRGSHVVGYVAPTRLDDLLTCIALVPVVRHRLGWNCQNWVYEALRGIGTRPTIKAGQGTETQPEMYTDPYMTWETLRAQMAWLLDAWERGDI